MTKAPHTAGGGQLRAIQAVACFTVFVDMMGVGLILPVMPQLLEQLAGVQTAEAAVIGD